MSLLTMTDCSDAGNRVQARHELDRAEDRPSYPSCHEWVAKWARPLLEFADNAPSEDDVSADLARAETEATDAENRVSALEDAIDAAVKALDKIEASEEVRDAIDAAIANLENSL